jgi:hypothetical protein
MIRTACINRASTVHPHGTRRHERSHANPAEMANPAEQEDAP